MRAMRTITNIFIANMAVADLAIAVFSIPFQFHTAVLQRWIADDVMCKIAPFVKDLSVNISILTLTVISIDRYIAVIYPFKAGFRKRMAFLVICIIWFVGIASSLPDLIYYDVKIKWTKNPVCGSKWPSKTFAKVYYLYLFLLQYFVPLTVISMSYSRIVCKIWGGESSGSEIGRCHQTRTSHKKKAVKMLIIVTSLFALCWLPLQTYNVVNAFYRPINRYKFINIIWFCSNWLAMSNSCYNPFIYGLFNEKFKQEFQNLLKCPQHCKETNLNRQLTLHEESLHKTNHSYHSLETLNRMQCSDAKSGHSENRKEIPQPEISEASQIQDQYTIEA